MKRTDIPSFLLASLVMLILIVQYFRTQAKKGDLLKHRMLVPGKVVEVRETSRDYIVDVDFAYEINGKLYNSSDMFSIYSSHREKFRGKVFPVAVDSTDFENSRMLIEPGNFLDFSIPFPDSLKWVKECQLMK